MSHPLLPRLRQALQPLQPLANPERAAPMRAYMKNQFAFLGVAAPVRRAAVAALVRPRLAHAELLTVATVTSADGNTTLSLSGGPSVTLVGVSSVSASDFDFTHGG